ncbi:hypothetical protein EB118_01135 [bacterium]|nr:hypothetical protein [bacterium]NBX97848.1 hypothetical protein [bacterium]NDC94299.1 hypothetical protein [bacterium]NDD84319.1 hypothetical protein [bacterium]NDG28692.1 hypothetical protein [bacterium]
MKKLKYAVSLLFIVGILLLIISLVTALLGLFSATTVLTFVLISFGMVTLAMLGSLILVTIQMSKDRSKPKTAYQQAWVDVLTSSLQIFPWY